MDEPAHKQTFWSRRREAFLDNFLFYIAVAVATVVVGLAAKFGTSEPKLPLWVVVLFGLVQLACVVALVVLFRRTRSSGTAQTTPAQPHPHQKLLARIDALDRSIAALSPTAPADWPAANAFNGILKDAQAASADFTLRDIEPLERGTEYFSSQAYSATNGVVRTLLGQIRSVLASEQQ
jgi:hypothetical protein